jgi:hypothetical protein
MQREKGIRDILFRKSRDVKKSCGSVITNVIVWIALKFLQTLNSRALSNWGQEGINVIKCFGNVEADIRNDVIR